MCWPRSPPSWGDGSIRRPPCGQRTSVGVGGERVMGGGTTHPRDAARQYRRRDDDEPRPASAQGEPARIEHYLDGESWGKQGRSAFAVGGRGAAMARSLAGSGPPFFRPGERAAADRHFG